MTSYKVHTSDDVVENGSLLTGNGKFAYVDSDAHPATGQSSQAHKTPNQNNGNNKDNNTNKKESTLSTLFRILSFRRKPKDSRDKDKDKSIDKSKSNGQLSNSLSESTSTPNRSRASSPTESKPASKPTANNQHKESSISRLVRSFSFLYKRPKSREHDAFKRSKSQSIQNFRSANKEYQSHSNTSSSNNISSSNNNNNNNNNNSSNKSTSTNNRKSNSVRSLSKGGSKNSLQSGDFVDNSKAVSKSLKVSRPHLVSAGIDTPGVSGIQNHGNTCFINSVIQCLSNTDTLAEYFIFDRFRVQHSPQQSQQQNDPQRAISPTSGAGGGDSASVSHSTSSTLLPQPLAVSLSGTTAINKDKKDGNTLELVENFAILIQSIWSCMYSSDISFQFKRVISKLSNQYTGNDQHDAQEFLLWLLDQLHEEILYQLHPDSHHANSLSRLAVNHKNEQESVHNNRAISTVVHDLFQGNLCSVVACPKCEYISKNFEPFLCLSLPVPIRLTFTIYVNIIFRDSKDSKTSQRKSGYYGISIHAESTMRTLREQICALMKVPSNRVLILQKDSIMTECSDDSFAIQDLFEDFTTIYAIETPEVKPTMNNAMNGMCEQYLTIVWMNQVKYERAGTKSEIFGPCFTAAVSREISYSGLKSTIVRAMSEYLINPKEMQLEEFCHNFDITLKLVDTNSMAQNSNSDYFVALQNLEHPLFVEDVEELLAKTESNDHYQGPYHIKLIVEWDNDVRRSLLVKDDEMDSIMEKKLSYIDRTVDQAKECSNKESKILLEDCLDTYFREENLSADNAWMCPGCNSRQQCVKQLNIHTFPNILVVHLKRFRHRNKVNTMIDYPMNKLDLSKYLTPHRFTDSSGGVKVGQLIDIGAPETYEKENCTYNLYGVVCHHGTMQSGHYTAYCKNPVDSSWYYYDDIKVIPVKAQQVLANDSYILFYQKSSLDIAPKKSTADHFLMKNVQNKESLRQSNLNLNHWSFRMPTFNYYTSETYANRSKTLPNNRSNRSNMNMGSVQNTKVSSSLNPFSKHSNNRNSNHSGRSTITGNGIPTSSTLNGTALHPKITKYDRSSSRLSDYGDKPVGNSLNSTFPRSRSSQRI